jgi:hypothetical protein
MSNLMEAARQYADRPKDERFPTPAAMLAAAQHDREYSRERTYNTKDLRVVTASTEFQPTPAESTLQLQSPKGSADFTHWSFGQLCRFIGAPASYLRQLPPTIAADALNYGLQEQTDHATDARLLIKANGTAPIVRAITSESYGRVWDAELYGAVAETIGQSAGWQAPPTWGGAEAEGCGWYRGDRDSFAILVNGGSIVNDPSGWDRATGRSGDGSMYRGIMVRNSEVGHCSVWIDTILFRAICGNHILWGATFDQRFKRRHVGEHAKRDAIRTILQAARTFTQQGAAADEAIIRQLIDREIAHTAAAVIDELRGLGATKDQADAAVRACEQFESASPRSFWGVAQGMTRISQDSGYQDDRLQLDQLAAAILARGRKLVAA